MKRRMSLGGRLLELELQCEGETCRFRSDGGPEREASVRNVEPGIYSVLLDGRSFEVKVVPGVEGLILDVQGRHLPVRIEDPRETAQRAGSGTSVGRGNVVSPMPGRVVRVLVSAGDAVTEGQGLVVVEAMKMQNELLAPRDGCVRELNAREGDTVAAGQVLVTIE